MLPLGGGQVLLLLESSLQLVNLLENKWICQSYKPRRFYGCFYSYWTTGILACLREDCFVLAEERRRIKTQIQSKPMRLRHPAKTKRVKTTSKLKVILRLFPNRPVSFETLFGTDPEMTPKNFKLNR